MTTRRLLLVAVRRWYVLLLGLVLTATACLLVRANAVTVYWARTVVTVLRTDVNPLHNEGDSLTSLASVLVLRANGEPATTKTSSSETTLYGEGVLSGTRIRLLDVGRQWTTSIPDPVIYVEAVGESADVVTADINRMVAGLTADLTQLQDEFGVDPATRAFLRLEPEQPAVAEVSGDRTRSVGATALIGVVLTALALYATDRRWPVAERTGRTGTSRFAIRQ